MTTTVQLSKTTVGFQNIVTEIQEEFATEYPWQDKLTSSLNTFLVDVMAALYTNAGAKADIAQLESFITTARRDSSIFACTRMLGVKINRRTSARADFNLTNNNNTKVSIDAYSPFSVGGALFYCREGIILESRETKTVTLYEGQVRLKEFDLSTRNLNIPEILLGEPNFSVSMDDLIVFTRDTATGELTEWEEHEESLSDLQPTDAKYFEATTGDGDVSLLFGDGIFGRKLKSSETLIVQYVTTKGKNGNIGSVGTRATSTVNTLVAGTSVESIKGGTFPKDPYYYKKYAPYVYQSRKSWNRPNAWKGNIMLYPGVADCVVQGQREIAPNDPSWMNVVRVCILPSDSATWGGDNPNPRSSLWNDFRAYAQERIGPHITIQTYNPKKILIDLSVEVSVEEWVNIQEMRATLRQDIISLFKRKSGMLGKRFSKSDVVDVCKFLPNEDTRRDGVDYVEVLKPTSDLEPQSKLEYVTLNSLTVFVKYTEREGR
jgi:hypothetical protein